MSQHSKYGTTFNALTGLELRKKILHDIEVMLDNDDRFRNHITYPRVKFDVKITIEAYPSEPNTFSLAADGDYGDPQIIGTPRTITVESQGKNQNPDRIRDEIGLPTPKPQATPEGIVDLTKAQADEQSTAALVQHAEPSPPRAPQSPRPDPLPPSRTADLAGTVQQFPPADTSVVVGGHGGVSRVERTEIPGHAVMRPLIIPREPANGRVAIANGAAADGAFGAPVEVEIFPHGESK